MTTQNIYPGELQNFIEEYADDYYAMMLLFFFGANPNVRFNRQAIFGTIGIENGRDDLKKALNTLVEKRVTDVSTDSPFTIYRLAEDTPARGQVMEMGKLSLKEKQELLRMTRGS